MKKILIVAVLSIGFFSMSNAQILRYQLENQSTEFWDMTMYDVGTATTTVELDINPTETRVGQIGNNLSPFAFPLKMNVQNSNGCSGNVVANGLSSGAFPIVCGSLAAANYSITQQQVIPFVVYALRVEFN